MATIQNVSLRDIMTGNHMDAGHNSMLIQITDKGAYFPRPMRDFKEVHQFDFHDLDHETGGSLDECLIEDEQAVQIAVLLKRALDENMNVVVHCHAGLCRSGAVAEVGTMIGFTDGGRDRLPNVLVKKKILQALGISYDPNVELKARYDEATKMAAEGKLYF